MRVLIVNTSEATGGAAIAANRLMEALKNNGVKATMMVRDKQTSQITVASTGNKWLMALRFLWERFLIYIAMGCKKKNIWQVDLANVGTDITSTDEFLQADVVHLHWVNQGFLSLNVIKKILNSGKRVVITMHDQWYFTGVCHYAADCEKFKQECKDCPMLKSKVFGSDLAKKTFRRKKDLFDKAKVSFVGCSRWMKEQAEQSAIARIHEVVNIPNPIDTTHFAPKDKALARSNMGLPADGKVILFGSQKITDERKGFSYLIEALNKLKDEHPDLARQITVVVVGANSSEVKSYVPFDVTAVDYISDERQMIDLYNAADLYVTPSLQDNLPNTIMEAMSCAVPCVGFNVGGIPEMIDHKINGYVAQYKDAKDFAKGIEWALSSDYYDEMARNAREKVLREYSESHIARLYTDIYESR